DRELRCDQHVRQQLRLEDRLLLHDGRGAGRRQAAPCGLPVLWFSASSQCTAVFSNCRSIALPFSTAASSASFAVFLPASACSISSAQRSRSCTMLPRRSPREFSVGSLLVNSFSGVSR